MQEREINLENEVEELTEEMQEWAEKQSQAEFGSDLAKELQFEAQQAERLRLGVASAKTEFSEITLQPKTDGLRRAIRDLTQETAYDSDQCTVAVCSVDAPYVEHNPNEISITDDELHKTLANIPDLHPAFVDWAYDKIEELGAMDAELGNSYLDMLMEARQTQMNQETTGSDTAE